LVSSKAKRTPRTLLRSAPLNALSGILAVAIMGWGSGPAPRVSEPTGPVSETKSSSCADPETAPPFPVISCTEKFVEVWNCGPELRQVGSPHCLATRKSSVLNADRFKAEAVLVWKNTPGPAAFQEMAAARCERSCCETRVMANCTFCVVYVAAGELEKSSTTVVTVELGESVYPRSTRVTFVTTAGS